MKSSFKHKVSSSQSQTNEYIISTISGLEHIAIYELEKILGSKPNITTLCNGRFLISLDPISLKKILNTARTILDIKKFIFHSQIEINPYNHNNTGLAEIEKKLTKLISTLNFSLIIKSLNLNVKPKTFAIEILTHPENTSNILKHLFAEFFIKNNLKVDLKNPDIKITIELIHSNIILALELTGKPLFKRDYIVQRHNQSINPCLAASLFLLAEKNFQQTITNAKILDPFCKDGIIPIEAAILSKNQKNMIYATDPEFRNIQKSKINAKLAKVSKNIRFSRTDIEWLDTKFQKGFFNYIITSPPYFSKSIPEVKIKGLYKEFLHTTSYISKAGSTTILILPAQKASPLISMLSNYDFILQLQHPIITQNTDFVILLINKK